MFETINNQDEERGQVGIGTLIVFIALVLVAAIAAGVLINTAGFLQNQAESTGEESSDQVTQSVQAQGVTGEVNSSTNSAVKFIEVKASLAPGADPIDANESTIEYIAPDGAATLTATASIGDTSTGSVSAVGSETYKIEESDTVLSSPSDQVTYNITLAPNNNAMSNLEPGEEATIRITTASGGTTTVVADVPDPLTASGGDEVRL